MADAREVTGMAEVTKCSTPLSPDTVTGLALSRQMESLTHTGHLAEWNSCSTQSSYTKLYLASKSNPTHGLPCGNQIIRMTRGVH